MFGACHGIVWGAPSKAGETGKNSPDQDYYALRAFWPHADPVPSGTVALPLVPQPEGETDAEQAPGPDNRIVEAAGAGPLQNARHEDCSDEQHEEGDFGPRRQPVIVPGTDRSNRSARTPPEIPQARSRRNPAAAGDGGGTGDIS